MTGAFRAVQMGQAVTVYVHGSSGIGKSMLVRRFLDTLRSRADVVVLAARCYAQEGVPYKALDPLMDRLSQYLHGLPIHEVQTLLPQAWAAVAQLFPTLGPVGERGAEPAPRLEPLDPQEGRQQACAALREFFARLAARHPVVLCIDDLQWGDSDSAELLTELLRPPAPPALLFVGCYRTEDAATSPLLRTSCRGMHSPDWWPRWCRSRWKRLIPRLPATSRQHCSGRPIRGSWRGPTPLPRTPAAIRSSFMNWCGMSTSVADRDLCPSPRTPRRPPGGATPSRSRSPWRGTRARSTH